MKEYYNTFDTFCLRTPLFPFSFYTDLTKKSYLSIDDFLKLLKNPILREAIYLASPELEMQLQKWEKGTVTEQKKIERLQYALLKYASRISTRCTPFGLFASCAAGNFDKTTNTEFEENQTHKRLTRFDMSFLSQMRMELLKDKKIRKHLLFYPNTSLYSISDHFRYMEYTFKNTKREYSLQGFRSNGFMHKILEKAKDGKKIHELNACILDDEITVEEANDYIEELIENQILISELEMTVTGDDYFKNLIKLIKEIPDTGEILEWLYQLNDGLLKIDRTIGNAMVHYEHLVELCKQRVPDLNTKYLLQTDSFLNLRSNTLHKQTIPQLLEAIPFFAKMGVPFPNVALDKFKTEFRKRYDDAKISLNTLMDAEVGIGYGTHKYDNSQFLDDAPTSFSKGRYQQVNWTGFDDVMQEKLFQAYQNKEHSIVLNDSDVDSFSDKWESPDTFSAMMEVVPGLVEKMYIAHFGGSSAANLLGRFTGGDENLFDHVQEIFDFEVQENPNKLLAEIVHLPESRVGNILQRPNTRNYEITYLGKSSLTPSHQVPIDDILVSVRHNKVILESRKLKKEIVPKLSNAHNFRGNPLPVYRFLCDLQHQKGRNSVGFSWNPILLKQPYLPRVGYKKLILAKARWLVKVSDFEKLIKSDDMGKAIETWRIGIYMPELIDFVERDHRLLINLKNESSILMLYNAVKKRSVFIVEEFLFENQNKGNGDKGFYCNQYVVSFYKKSKINV